MEGECCYIRVRKMISERRIWNIVLGLRNWKIRLMWRHCGQCRTKALCEKYCWHNCARYIGNQNNNNEQHFMNKVQLICSGKCLPHHGTSQNLDSISQNESPVLKTPQTAVDGATAPITALSVSAGCQEPWGRVREEQGTHTNTVHHHYRSTAVSLGPGW